MVPFTPQMFLLFFCFTSCFYAFLLYTYVRFWKTKSWKFIASVYCFLSLIHWSAAAFFCFVIYFANLLFWCSLIERNDFLSSFLFSPFKILLFKSFYVCFFFCWINWTSDWFVWLFPLPLQNVIVFTSIHLKSG